MTKRQLLLYGSACNDYIQGVSIYLTPFSIAKLATREWQNPARKNSEISMSIACKTDAFSKHVILHQQTDAGAIAGYLI